MPRIQVLSDLLVNKIAAGEVIERPASVVKELVENSLDAGAEHIEIAIEEGGRRLIRVTDDGGGMDAGDLAMCVQPHATSKIRSEDDLFGIRTMGFRGEALPSIGAVSQLRVTSRQPEANEAYEIRVVGDRIEPVTATAGPPGTTVEVRELFFNVPARQKFLRTAQTEMGHITEQLARIALVTPHVEFRLTHNGRQVHQLRPAVGLRERVADFYGHELAAALLSIRREERGLSIDGLISTPADSRSSQKWQYLFLNGRFIRDRFLGHALREAYRGLVDPSRSPVIFLALRIDPAHVDVNVHPTKIEVRWRDSNLVYSQVLSVIRERLLGSDLTPRFDAGTAKRAEGERGRGGGGENGDPGAELAEERRREVRAAMAEYFKRTGAVPPPSHPAFGGSHASLSGAPADETLQPPSLADTAAAADLIARAADGLQASGQAEIDLLTAGRGEPLRDACDPAPEPTPVLQIHRTYLVSETPEGLMIIDQHALHERILFEQLVDRIARGPLESQRMLIPDILEVSADHIGVIETYGDTLQRLGFELTPYSSNTIAVHAAPTLLQEGRMREFLRDLLDKLAVRSGPASTELVINDLLSMMACKAAVKAGDPLTDAEIQALMRDRHRVERSSNCPHGRPTALRLTLRDLERQFKRA